MPCSNSGGGVQKKIWKQLQPSDSVEDLRLLIQLNLKHPLLQRRWTANLTGLETVQQHEITNMFKGCYCKNFGLETL